MNSSIAFREATVEDADAIADQIVASRDRVRDYDGGHRWHFAKPPRKVWLALIDGRVVGHVACHLTTKQGFEAELQSIFVRPEFQRRGLGTDLLRMAVDWRG